MEYNKVVEFYIKREKTFTVSVKAWSYNDKWNWNVYAYIFDTHPLFGDDEALLGLPFHGGTTYDRLETKQPLDLKYDFQKVTQTKVVGSDYNHIHDDFDHHPSPDEGVMYQAERDAIELVKALEAQ